MDKRQVLAGRLVFVPMVMVVALGSRGVRASRSRRLQRSPAVPAYEGRRAHRRLGGMHLDVGMQRCTRIARQSRRLPLASSP